MSDGEPDIQRFDSDGTWVKPPGAVRLTVKLKGGAGDNSVGAIPRAVTFQADGGGYRLDGRGGGAGGTSFGGPGAVTDHLVGGGGGGSAGVTALDMGTVEHAPEWTAVPGADGELVEFSYDADDVPDRMDLKIGRGGYAVITTHVEVQ